MNTFRLLYLLVVTTATIMKANAEADDHSILAKGLSGLRGTYLKPVGKKKKSESVKHNVRRTLNKGTTNIFSRAREDDNFFPFFDCDNNDDYDYDYDYDYLSSESASPSTIPSASASESPSASTSPSKSPTVNPTYVEKKFLASDGESGDRFGRSCSMTDDLVVIGALYAGENGAAYLFRLDGTEVSKLEPEDNGDSEDFGEVVSIDEKVVVGLGSGTAKYVRVFSLDGTYERTITHDGLYFGAAVATLGNKIVTKSNGLLIYKTDGDLLKEIEVYNKIWDVAISSEYIVCITSTETFVHSNVEPDFPLVREIEQGGKKVSITGDKLVIGYSYANDYVGSAWLYNIDGTLVKELEHDAQDNSYFGTSVAIANDKIIIGAEGDFSNKGSVFFYSAIDGAFQEKVLAPDAQFGDRFGSSACSNGSYYMVGAWFDENRSGSAYLFNLPS